MSESGRDERGRTIYIAVVAAVIVSVATTYGLRALEGEIGGSTVKAPDLVGLELEPARELANNRGLELLVAGERHGPIATKGRILSQDAFPESDISSGTTLQVITNVGPDMVEVPSIAGMSLADARAALSAVGLGVGDQSEGGDGPAGTVTASTPGAGTEAPVGGAVAVVLAPDGVLVPDVLGQSQRAARTALQELGLEIAIRRRWNEGRPEMSVLDIDPAAGSRVQPGAQITLTIND
ncbi:MAG: PASTA domain-containing protein [Myxococcota bacterium]